jgi:hypothetical protein
MNTGRKITRHTIPGEQIPEFFFLGVVSSEPDYRLSVMINKHLGTDLRKCPDVITLGSDTGNPAFSRFTSVTQDFSLVSNRSEGNLLLRKLKNIDFFFLMTIKADRQHVESLAISLREMPEVTAVFVLISREISDRNLSLLAL